MPLALYDLPNALMGLLICAGWSLAGIGGYLLFHRVCRARFSEGEKNLAIALLAVVATVNSLLMAFSAVSAWDTFGSADKAVHGEAVSIGALGRTLAVFDSPDALGARSLLRHYGQTVLDAEWPAMRLARSDEVRWDAFDQVFRAVGRIEPANARQAALLPEIWTLTNELLRYRRERLYASQARIPGTLWIVVVAGTLLTIMTTFVFQRSAFNLVAVGLLSIALGLVFFFIVAMDRPFAGAEHIGPGPIVSTLANMDRWDAHPLPSPARTGGSN